MRGLPRGQRRGRTAATLNPAGQRARSTRSCELRLEEDQVARASYSVGPHARRRGFASRALQLATQWAFDELGVARIELYIEFDNVASRGVARRCGFLEEGVLRSRFRIGDARRDALLYARLAADRCDE